jgi:hypothetical protein
LLREVFALAVASLFKLLRHHFIHLYSFADASIFIQSGLILFQILLAP